MTWTMPAVLDEAHGDAAIALLRQYFRVGTDGQPSFTGAMFDRLDDGGDKRDLANRFTFSDIVAVSMLSVDVPASASLRLLNPDQHYFSDLLADLPLDLDLVDATGDHIQAGERLWKLVREAGVGPVTTSKLLARKRPRLLPVIDSVVKQVLSHPRRGDFYRTLNDQLAADNRALHNHLEDLRKRAGIGDDISAIRCFDIIVWLAGRYPETESK